MISNILIPTDFSPASWNATQLGLELSHLNGGAKLSFLHIYPVTSKYIEVGSGKMNHQVMDDMKVKMNQLSQSLKVNGDSDVEIDNVVLSGNVDEIITSFIGENQFDLVIVGINSNGNNNDIGSHTVKLIKESGIPVMIVPNRSGQWRSYELKGLPVTIAEILAMNLSKPIHIISVATVVGSI